MHPIYIMAILTTAIVLLLIGGFLFFKAPKPERPFLLFLLLAELPMCILAYQLIRVPLLLALQHFFTPTSTPFLLISSFFAPLTEEPAKIYLLLIPFLRRRITRQNFWRAALALGLGFGIGELWFVAGLDTLAPQSANIPWYQFTGFLNERFMVCLNHAWFVSLSLFFLTRKQFLRGFALAMLAHYLGNLPLFLAQIHLFNLPPQFWSVFVLLFIPLYLIAGMLLFIGLVFFTPSAPPDPAAPPAPGTPPGTPSFAAQLGSFLHGNSTCPECHFQYPAPLIALNLLTHRYEECPNCKKWHLVSRLPKRPTPPPPAAPPPPSEPQA